MSEMPQRRTLVGILAVSWVLLMTPSPATGIEVHLVVKAFQKTMPDGTSVPMWGFARDADSDRAGAGAASD